MGYKENKNDFGYLTIGIPMRGFEMPNSVDALVEMWKSVRQEIQDIRSFIGTTLTEMVCSPSREVDLPLENLTSFLAEHANTTGGKLTDAFLAWQFPVANESVREALLRDLGPINERMITALFLTKINAEQDVPNQPSEEKLFSPQQEDFAKCLAAQPSVQLRFLFVNTTQILMRAQKLAHDIAEQNDGNDRAVDQLDYIQRCLETVEFKVDMWEQSEASFWQQGPGTATKPRSVPPHWVGESSRPEL